MPNINKRIYSWLYICLNLHQKSGAAYTSSMNVKKHVLSQLYANFRFAAFFLS